jgi:hypothetical protein
MVSIKLLPTKELPASTSPSLPNKFYQLFKFTIEYLNILNGEHTKKKYERVFPRVHSLVRRRIHSNQTQRGVMDFIGLEICRKCRRKQRIVAILPQNRPFCCKNDFDFDMSSFLWHLMVYQNRKYTYVDKVFRTVDIFVYYLELWEFSFLSKIM